ncbi:MAG: hypothetical protein JWP63_1463, partial [Candidatus Solibacter sp.]|nr:hypothetical protein [Candidatus Solibacter sp.]
MTSDTKSRSWLARNGKKLAAVVLCLVGIVSVLVAFHDAEATKLALATASSDSAVVERLGMPIHAGWFIGGMIEVTAGFRRAELAIL